MVAAPALGFTFPADGLKHILVPILLWRAENDTILPHPRYAETVRQALPRAPDYRVVPTGHYDFLAPCSDALAAAICKSAARFYRTSFHAAFNRDVVKFFETTLADR